MCGKEIVSTKPRRKSVYDSLVYDVFVLSPVLRDIFHTAMAPHSLFVLKVPLNTNQPGSILSVESSQNVDSKTKNVESKLKNVESKIAYLVS